MALGGTSPSSFLFLPGRAHATIAVVGASFCPQRVMGRGSKRVHADAEKGLGPVAQLVRARA